MMSKKLIIESSETGREEIVYESLSAEEIDKRIAGYEKKYGMTYARYNRRFSCDDALPWEMGDLMDWENLMQERKARKKKPSYDIA